MPRLLIYVLRQLVGPIALFTFLLTSVIWLSQSLRLLDLVINRGQSAPTFLYLTVLMLPGLLVIILPVAFFAGALYGLHKLNADSELMVMSAAGFSRNQLLIPVLIAAIAAMAGTYFCSLYLSPYSQRLMKDKELDIRADIAGAILSEGQFNTPALGLTVFLRELSPSGEMKGILVHDNTNTKEPTTYIAEHGELAQTPAGPRLIMEDGTIEQGSQGGAQLSVLKFQRYVFDLDKFSGQQGAPELRKSERYLNELLWPSTKGAGGQTMREIYFAEANNRLSAPLYCVAFALIAFAAVTLGRRGRGAYALRLTLAVLGAVGLRILGYGIEGLAERHPVWCVLFYLIPLSAAVMAYLDISGFDLGWLAGYLRPERLETAA